MAPVRTAMIKGIMDSLKSITIKLVKPTGKRELLKTSTTEVLKHFSQVPVHFPRRINCFQRSKRAVQFEKVSLYR